MKRIDFFSKFESRIANRIQKAKCPVRGDFSPGVNDVMLTSYPKSGNTWLRVMLSNLAKTDPSLGAIEEIIPDIYKSNMKRIESAPVFEFGGRIFKSHEAYRPFYKKVIYVYRDPRDVLVSYYFYLKKRGRVGSGINSKERFVDEFLAGRFNNFGSWRENVESWLWLKKENIIFVRYEDLLLDTKKELRKIFEFLGCVKSMVEIEEIVNRSSLKNLRNKEQSERSKWTETATSKGQGAFFRHGTKSQWNEFGVEVAKPIECQWGDVMREMGYMTS